LEVKYNSELDCLVYDRKLKDGSGPRIYGLEVCKSLYMNNSFIESAFKLRNKYFADTRGILSGNKSKYNASKIKGMCEICKTKMGTEVHHLQQQKEADNDGFIGNFHKNHKANLVSICEECHDKMHNNTIEKVPTKKKKTTKGIKLF
jgi:DNA mismatch repair protein MutS